MPFVTPLCPVFGECGGCRYQDIPYEEELRLKQEEIQKLFKEKVDSIVPCDHPFHYRNRLDLKLMRTKRHGILMGFSPSGFSPSGKTPKGKNRLVPIAACVIAREEISAFLPQLKKEAVDKLPAKYRMANLVVRSGEEKKVFWGGIGRRSLRMEEKDYFWTMIEGKKIFYSLETFFQANLSILPKLTKHLRGLDVWWGAELFYDLYGGVGLFGICLRDLVKGVILIEEHQASIKLARYNAAYHDLKNFEIIHGKVEDHLPQKENALAMIDPPRNGLSETALKSLIQAKNLKALLYLSCHPESLRRDLEGFTQNGWQIQQIIPFDFFPKTKHIETLAVLSP